MRLAVKTLTSVGAGKAGGVRCLGRGPREPAEPLLGGAWPRSASLPFQGAPTPTLQGSSRGETLSAGPSERESQGQGLRGACPGPPLIPGDASGPGGTRDARSTR